MSGDRFNAKTYQGKDRVYQPVPGKTGILRLYIWDKNKKQYVDPPGKKYDVRRIEIGENGKKRRRKKMFAHLDQGVFGCDPVSLTDPQIAPLPSLKVPY